MSPTVLRRNIERVALLVLLATVGLRPLISETLQTSGTAITTSLPGLEDSMAATTIVIDLIVLLAGSLVVLGRVASGRYRVTGLEWGAAGLLLALVISSLFADAKRTAIVGSTDLMASIVLAIALTQLFDTRWAFSLGLGVIIASGAANSAESIDQRLVGFEQTEQDYMENRDRIWAEQGVSLDSAQVRLFEQRMRAREASGYFAHSNVAGGYLLIPLLAAMGVIIGGARRDADGGRTLAWLVMIGAVGGVAVAILFSTSVAALAAGAIGVMVVAATLLLRDWVGRHRLPLFVAGWSCVGLVLLGVVLYGLNRGGLPHPSLDFRWGYWTASTRMVEDHPWAGVGAENFGDHYVRYKTIEDPEEIKNPHNFGVQFAAEFGALGIVSLLLLLVGGAWRATAPVAVSIDVSDERDQGTGVGKIAYGAVLGLLIFGPRTRLLSSDDPNFVLWMTAFPALFWLAGFAATVVASRDVVAEQRRTAVLGTALSCGLLAFLVQDLVNFGLFVPGARTTFFAALAMSVSLRLPKASSVETAPHRSAAMWVAVGICSVSFIAAIALSPSPIRSEFALRTARRAASPDPWFASATRLDPLDATAPTEHARWLASMAGSSQSDEERRGWLTRAMDTSLEAIRCAPSRYSLWRLRAACCLMRGKLGGGAEDFDFAVTAARRAIECYPNRPESYVELGDCLVAVGSCEAFGEAIGAFGRALELDDARPDWEVFRRLSAKQRQSIKDRIEQVRSRQEAQCPSEVDRSRAD